MTDCELLSIKYPCVICQGKRQMSWLYPGTGGHWWSRCRTHSPQESILKKKMCSRVFLKLVVTVSGYDWKTRLFHSSCFAFGYGDLKIKFLKCIHCVQIPEVTDDSHDLHLHSPVCLMICEILEIRQCSGLMHYIDLGEILIFNFELKLKFHSVS